MYRKIADIRGDKNSVGLICTCGNPYVIWDHPDIRHYLRGKKKWDSRGGQGQALVVRRSVAKYGEGSDGSIQEMTVDEALAYFEGLGVDLECDATIEIDRKRGDYWRWVNE
jgi:hypothetical protein